MTENLTDRQTLILKSIINEYIETAEPVGSETLEKKHNLGVSPATLRNEMAKLTEAGFLKQPHTSAGRIPTSKALKLYVNQLMKPKELSVADEVSVKEKIWDCRTHFDKLMREATKTLAKKTNALGMATTDEGTLYYAGAANILEMPEFFDIDLTKNVLLALDDFSFWQRLFDRVVEGEDPIQLLMGEDLGELLSPCSLVYTHYNLGQRHGTIGVIGPSRIDYSYVIPVVRYFGNLINEIGKDWA